MPAIKPVQYTLNAVSIPAATVIVSAVSGFSVSQNFCSILGLSEQHRSSDFCFYPNPASSRLKFTGIQPDVNAEVKISDITGREVMNTKFISEMDVSNLSPGIYLVKLKTNGHLYVNRFIKE